MISITIARGKRMKITRSGLSPLYIVGPATATLLEEENPITPQGSGGGGHGDPDKR